MSIWGDIIGIGGDIAGAAIGMPWLGTAATAIGGAVNSSNASTSAANAQIQGANQAQQTLSPFSNMGVSALGRLGSLYGLGSGVGGPSAAPAAGVTSGPPPIPPGSGVLPPGNPSTGQLTEYGPGWATYPGTAPPPDLPPGMTLGQYYRQPPPSTGGFTNTLS